MERTQAGEVHGKCLLWESPQAGAEEECKESFPGGGGSERDHVLPTDHCSYFQSLVLLRWRKSGMKSAQEEGRNGKEYVSNFWFISHYPTMILLVIN